MTVEYTLNHCHVERIRGSLRMRMSRNIPMKSPLPCGFREFSRYIFLKCLDAAFTTEPLSGSFDFAPALASLARRCAQDDQGVGVDLPGGNLTSTKYSSGKGNPLLIHQQSCESQLRQPSGPAPQHRVSPLEARQ